MLDQSHITTRTLQLPDQNITYRFYRNPKVANKRKLVLLHGAGVAGIDTWMLIASWLNYWNEILIPDIRGMGDTYYPDGQDYPCDLQTYVADLNALVDHVGWFEFDLGGYSLGGLISMLFKQQHSDRIGKQFLIESAMLDQSCLETSIILREDFSKAAEKLKTTDSRGGVVNFMDAISPNRKVSPQVEELTIERLSKRPLGFAYALDSVTSAIRIIDREALVAAQGDVTSVIGGLSVDPMHEYHKDMAAGMPNWHYFMVPGTDHSLPYQKPRQIAKIFNQEMQRYLESGD